MHGGGRARPTPAGEVVPETNDCLGQHLLTVFKSRAIILIFPCTSGQIIKKIHYKAAWCAPKYISTREF